MFAQSLLLSNLTSLLFWEVLLTILSAVLLSSSQSPGLSPHAQLIWVSLMGSQVFSEGFSALQPTQLVLGFQESSDIGELGLRQAGEPRQG